LSSNAIIIISPLVCPLCLLIVVLSSRQSQRCQQWCYCCCHGRYIANSIVVVGVAARDDGSSTSSLNLQSTPRTNVDAANHNNGNQAMAISTEESTFFLPALS
jgi:hypothetical protein